MSALRPARTYRHGRLPTGEVAYAEYSLCERYRYVLGVEWLAPLVARPIVPPRRLLWVMLNPSTATEQRLDPTVRRCVGFARRWGYDATEVCNLFAWRATDPDDLYRAGSQGENITGRGNDQVVLERAGRCNTVVVAWGGHGDTMHAGERMLALLRRSGHLVHRLGSLTKYGHPRHPLYLSSSTPIESWPA